MMSSTASVGRRGRSLRLSAVLVATAAWGGTALAGFDNFGPDFEYGNTGAVFFTGQELAMAFTAERSGGVTDIYVGLIGGGHDLQFNLYNDGGDVPGASIGSWAVAHFGTVGGSPAHVEVDPGVALSAGARYWLSVEFTDFGGENEAIWADNVTGHFDARMSSFFGGAWSTDVEQALTGAFAVVVPAPSAMAVLLAGGVLGTRRRR